MPLCWSTQAPAAGRPQPRTAGWKLGPRLATASASLATWEGAAEGAGAVIGLTPELLSPVLFPAGHRSSRSPKVPLSCLSGETLVSAVMPIPLFYLRKGLRTDAQLLGREGTPLSEIVVPKISRQLQRGCRSPWRGLPTQSMSFFPVDHILSEAGVQGKALVYLRPGH